MGTSFLNCQRQDQRLLQHCCLSTCLTWTWFVTQNFIWLPSRGTAALLPCWRTKLMVMKKKMKIMMKKMQMKTEIFRRNGYIFCWVRWKGQKLSLMSLLSKAMQFLLYYITVWKAHFCFLSSQLVIRSHNIRTTYLITHPALTNCSNQTC